MGYYGSLNKQISAYSADAKKQYKNDIKQMIKYQAYLDTENIDDKLAEKLATLYSDVQGKLAKKNATPAMKIATSVPITTAIPTRTIGTQGSQYSASRVYDYPSSKLKTDIQKEKYRQLLDAGIDISVDEMNKTKNINTLLSNKLRQIKSRSSLDTNYGLSNLFPQ